MQELEKILEEMKKIKDGNRKENLYAKYPPKDEQGKSLNGYSQGYEDGTDNFYNVMVDIIRKHMNDGWIPVEERLPEDGQIVIISMYNNIKWVTIGSQCGGVWKPYNYITDLGIDVKAWRYLPDPYRSEKGE
jgi:hypothetical protein